MEQKMQPRSNSRSLPTLDLRQGVTVRRVEEAYLDSNQVDNTANKQQILLFCAIWFLFIVCLVAWAIITYPPSLVMLIIELLTGVAVTGVLFILKWRKP